MPTELSVRFTTDDDQADGPIRVSFFRPDSGASTPPVPFDPPLDDAALADIRWYLEVFSTWPSGPDFVRAREIEAKLPGWGRDLRDSITDSQAAARAWQQFVDSPAEDRLLTIDATDPRVLRLPWELLADESGHLFSLGIGVRRRLQEGTRAQPPRDFDPPVRILIVVSRPDDAGFIDPRVVSRPLLDALDALGGAVAAEFLYPPTVGALTDRLRDRHAPPVHVVHFDGHGVYDRRAGLGYLLFENDDYGRDPVDAERLGTLLNQCRVPLMALNACQSGQQEEANAYASVAARLIRAGVGSVLAMNYSVLVEAVRRFVPAFYGGLADGLSIGRATDEGRYALLKSLDRHRYTRLDEKTLAQVEETMRLVDWFLPSLYQQAADPVIFPVGERKSGVAGEQGSRGDQSGDDGGFSPAPPLPSPTPPPTASTAARGRCWPWSGPSPRIRWSSSTASAGRARRPWRPRRGAGSTARGASPAARPSFPSRGAAR